MFQAGLITFRETLEATLVVGIMLSFLAKTNQHVFKKYVWYGVLSGIIASILLAQSLELFFGGLTGRSEEIFEGVLMFVTAGFLTWMILWVHRQKQVIANLKKQMIHHASRNFGWGITLLTFTTVIREGGETVMYLKATGLATGGNQFAGAFIGIAIALLTGYVMFRWALQHKLTTVFQATSVVLLLFAAGLVMHGVHEFQEAGFLPIFSIDPLWNISSVLSHSEGIGSILRALFGYTAKPTILELASYGVYIGFIFWLERFTDQLISSKVKTQA